MDDVCHYVVDLIITSSRVVKNQGFFFFNFTRLENLQCYTRGLNQVWLHVENKVEIY